MPSANLDLVRSLYAAWERGDRSSIEWAHPEIEFVIADGPAPGRWIGVAGMAEGFRDLLSGWEEWRPQADEYRELDAERILVLDHFSGRGKTSGLEVRQMRTEKWPCSTSAAARSHASSSTETVSVGSRKRPRSEARGPTRMIPSQMVALRGLTGRCCLARFPTVLAGEWSA
jgi:ketosteroid isomerase-like protein